MTLDSIMLLMIFLVTGTRTVLVLRLLWRDNQQERIRQRGREAERRIAEIGRQTRAAMWETALRQAPRQAKAVRLDNPSFNADGRYGPWND